MFRRPFHLVEPRPWPFLAGIGGLLLTIGTVVWFHLYEKDIIKIGGGVLVLVIYQWWRDVIREGSYIGYHTLEVVQGLRLGIILFIISEVCFFFAFFWAFFHSRLSPVFQLGVAWPPEGIEAINAFSIPLLNTAVLLASGVTVTWAHHSLIEGYRFQAIQALFITVLLGIYFTILQVGEYFLATFRVADRVYGSVFFVATGFHGLHVLIGRRFLIVGLYRVIKGHFSKRHHFGFEAAAWYWHFVDVVWIFLFICIYWWGR